MSQKTKMPETYEVCIAEEGGCPLRDTCLRSKIFRETDYTAKRGNRKLAVVNLWNPELQPLTESCESYRKAETQRFAQGFSHLYDNVPKGDYATVQQLVQRLFSSKRHYYYCKNGTYLTSPKEQEKIARIFEKRGVEGEPQYDALVDVYDWS